MDDDAIYISGVSPGTHCWPERDDLVKAAFLGAMSDGIDQALKRNITSGRWPAHYAQRLLWKKGIDPKRIHAVVSKLIMENDVDFYALQVEAYFQAASIAALRQLRPTEYPTAESYIEAFLPLFKTELVAKGFLLLVGRKVPIEELMEVDGFKDEVVRQTEALKQAWAQSIEQCYQRTRRTILTAEEIGYRRLERVERHRLKRLAEQEAARKAEAEEALKRKSEEARLERDRRKAEARARGEQARERAKQRAEEKRAQWLAEHPRKHAS